MNKKFGGGKPPTGTPSMAWSTVVVVVSLLTGASVVHNIYKPNLVIKTQPTKPYFANFTYAHHMLDEMPPKNYTV